MSLRRSLIITLLLLVGTIVLLNQLAAAHRRGVVKQFVASLDQRVEPESVRRWAAEVIASQ